MTNRTPSIHRRVLLTILIIWDFFAETKQEAMLLRTFGSVSGVNLADNIDSSTRTETVSTKMRCTSLCVQLGCQCTSFLYDDTAKECYMFPRTLITGTGSKKGYNKLTACATPRQIPDADLLSTYTGCSATYSCNFGYSSSASSDSNVITCQEDEIWKPSDYACVQIPCPTPASLTNGHNTVTSPSVGGEALYSCDTNFVNHGGDGKTLMCVLGGTWSGNIDMVCVPAYISYLIEISTGTVNNAGTNALVSIHLYGQRDDFRIPFPKNSAFEKGDIDTVQTSNINIGPLEKVVVSHDNTGTHAGWFVESVRMEIDDGGQKLHYYWNVGAWIQVGNLEKTLIVP